MTPPLGLALAAALFKNRFTQEERDAGKAAAVLGLSFVTEGAIPFAARDPLRVIPCLVAGSMVTGAISMASGVQLMVPHGGVFVLLIPHAVQPLGMYVIALAAGTVVTAVALRVALRPVAGAGLPESEVVGGRGA
jgi:PTS system fructose-specific IIC component